MIFAKAPIPGQVKSRLARDRGAINASRCYRLMLSRLLQDLSQLDAMMDLQLWCSPDKRHAYFRSCARKYPLSLHVQKGKGLGQRMFAGFRYNYRLGYRTILLCGSDLPELNTNTIIEASESLKSGVDAVLLPTYDGGYGLVGLSCLEPSLFANMPWSTESVLRQSMSRLIKRGRCYSLMDYHRDLDTCQDYRFFKRKGLV